VQHGLHGKRHITGFSIAIMLLLLNIISVYTVSSATSAKSYAPFVPQWLYWSVRDLGNVVEVNGRIVEKLGRGVIALRIGEKEAYITWRLLVTDPPNVMFNIYRRYGDGPFVRINDLPVYETNFVDRNVDFSHNVTYWVCPIINGVEKCDNHFSSFWTLPANAPIRNYIVIPLAQDAVDYNGTVQDVRLVGVGDIDGDGEYEFIVKRGNQDIDPAHETKPTETYKIEVYDDIWHGGKFLWRIDLGPNIRPGIYYSPFVVYDLDGDGKAEIALKMNDLNNVWANPDNGRDLTGPEWLIVLEGATGKVLANVSWIPRGNVSDWGDNYGNRADRHMIYVAYLDGKLPSLIIQRGIYEKIVIEAWNFRNGSMTRLWRWTYIPVAKEPYTSNGTTVTLKNATVIEESFVGGYTIRIYWVNSTIIEAHQQARAADIDLDGYDEVIPGSFVLRNNGSLWWYTGQGHGDRFHVADIDPFTPGLEIFYVQERKIIGISLWSADGRMLWGKWGPGISGQDIGRGSCADIDPRYPGYECWATRGDLYNAKGESIAPRLSVVNFAIWWDGDLLRELLDIGPSPNIYSVYKYNYTTGVLSIIFNATDVVAGSRNAPAAYGDFVGDWREEFMLMSSDKKELRLYISTIPTKIRIPTLMQDPYYRLTVSQETHGYMQSTWTSFYLGAELEPLLSNPIVIPVTTTATYTTVVPTTIRTTITSPTTVVIPTTVTTAIPTTVVSTYTTLVPTTITTEKTLTTTQMLTTTYTTTRVEATTVTATSISLSTTTVTATVTDWITATVLAVVLLVIGFATGYMVRRK